MGRHCLLAAEMIRRKSEGISDQTSVQDFHCPGEQNIDRASQQIPSQFTGWKGGHTCTPYPPNLPPTLNKSRPIDPTRQQTCFRHTQMLMLHILMTQASIWAAVVLIQPHEPECLVYSRLICVGSSYPAELWVVYLAFTLRQGKGSIHAYYALPGSVALQCVKPLVKGSCLCPHPHTNPEMRRHGSDEEVGPH